MREGPREHNKEQGEKLGNNIYVLPPNLREVIATFDEQIAMAHASLEHFKEKVAEIDDLEARVRLDNLVLQKTAEIDALKLDRDAKLIELGKEDSYRENADDELGQAHTTIN